MTRRSFGDVLDAALDRTAGPRAAVAGIGTAGLFAAPFSPWWRGTSPSTLYAAALPGEAVVLCDPPSAEPLLRPRTDAERQAWRRLQDLGAGLPQAFAASHLKRAFRRLARQLHPDRQPALDAAASADQCRAFADARAAYDVLIAIGRPAA